MDPSSTSSRPAQPKKDKCLLLIAGFIKAIETKLEGEVIPNDVNIICSNFYYLAMIMDSKILNEEEKFTLRQLFIK